MPYAEVTNCCAVGAVTTVVLGICVKLLVPDHVLFDESNDAGLVGAVVCVVPSLNLIPALNVFTADQVFVAESCPTNVASYGTVCVAPELLNFKPAVN